MPTNVVEGLMHDRMLIDMCAQSYRFASETVKDRWPAGRWAYVAANMIILFWTKIALVYRGHHAARICDIILPL